MCGRFAADVAVDRDIRRFLDVTGQRLTDYEPGWHESWNIPPTRGIPLLRETLTDDGELVRHADTAHWSLVPPWSSELKQRYPTFNARCETLAEKRTWKGPLKGSRGIIPATGYYEWTSEPGGKKKRPHFIYDPEGVLHFAALYSWWRPKGSEDEWTLTAAIVTRPATGNVSVLHDRTPLVLPDDAMADWLDPAREGDQSLVDAMVAASDPVVERLAFHEVRGPLTGDGPELAEPING
ncbi:SOS response-associated peptidase [Brevibacterium sp.]|uniref:SOS response-associated peptidase n=1 Tax=Brevibacterium sp. TaxID=1701 RepID=UPI0025BE21C6|nr:SOS response-associated peptidase [Brevibacterium sp.]